MANLNFDIVVIGGGSAGGALVGRLAQERSLRICLVEAGPDYGAFENGRWPQELLDPRRRPHSHEWDYAEPRAKVIGGCSAHNQCAAIWPVPEDFDQWAALGNPGWSYADLRSLIDQIERDLSPVEEPYRGHHGIVPTAPFADDALSTWHRTFLDACLAAGLPRVHDLSAPEPAIGVTPFHANIYHAVRWNTAFAFLDPVRGNPNLTILAETLADRLVVQKGRAAELICHSRGEPLRLRASRFVLTSGTFGSPATLLRSGIGPAQHLRELGIPVQIDLPGVGQNLHDHPGTKIALKPSEQMERAMEEDLKHQRFYQSQMNARARSEHSAVPFDLHLISYENVSQSGQRTLQLMAYNMAPRSRGFVRLQKADPQVAPQIDFKFLSDPDGHDLAVLTDALELLRRIAQTNPLVAMIARERKPGSEIRQPDARQDYIRRNVDGYSHPVGTCKMAPSSDPGTVVDAVGHIYGAENIFVADASIIPQIPRANINLLCFLIGWRLADQILR